MRIVVFLTCILYFIFAEELSVYIEYYYDEYCSSIIHRKCHKEIGKDYCEKFCFPLKKDLESKEICDENSSYKIEQIYGDRSSFKYSFQFFNNSNCNGNAVYEKEVPATICKNIFLEEFNSSINRSDVLTYVRFYRSCSRKIIDFSEFPTLEVGIYSFIILFILFFMVIIFLFFYCCLNKNIKSIVLVESEKEKGSVKIICCDCGNFFICNILKSIILLLSYEIKKFLVIIFSISVNLWLLDGGKSESAEKYFYEDMKDQVQLIFMIIFGFFTFIDAILLSLDVIKSPTILLSPLKFITVIMSRKEWIIYRAFNSCYYIFLIFMNIVVLFSSFFLAEASYYYVQTIPQYLKIGTYHPERIPNYLIDPTNYFKYLVKDLITYIGTTLLLLSELSKVLSFNGPISQYHTKKIMDQQKIGKKILPESNITLLKCLSGDFITYLNDLISVVQIANKMSKKEMEKSKTSQMHSHLNWILLNGYSEEDIELLYYFFCSSDIGLEQQSTIFSSVLYDSPFKIKWIKHCLFLSCVFPFNKNQFLKKEEKMKYNEESELQEDKQLKQEENQEKENDLNENEESKEIQKEDKIHE